MDIDKASVTSKGSKEGSGEESAGMGKETSTVTDSEDKGRKSPKDEAQASSRASSGKSGRGEFFCNRICTCISWISGDLGKPSPTQSIYR